MDTGLIDKREAMQYSAFDKKSIADSPMGSATAELRELSMLPTRPLSNMESLRNRTELAIAS